MGVISISSTGSFKNTENFLNRMSKGEIFNKLESYGRVGVDALSSATPSRTGLTASSWGYEVHHSRGKWEIIWTNSNINQGVPIAILLQYGHGTGTGGYVQGIDYINPAIRPIFDQIANDVWKAVTSA